MIRRPSGWPLGANFQSDVGVLFRSNDGGASWARVDMGVEPKTTMFAIAFDERQPKRMYCATSGGEVFASEDGGQSWAERPLPDGRHAGLRDGVRLARARIRAHLLRWRPRPPAQRRATTPRGCHRAPPRSWTLLLALAGFLRPAPKRRRVSASPGSARARRDRSWRRGRARPTGESRRHPAGRDRPPRRPPS